MVPYLDLQRLNRPYEQKFKEVFKGFLNSGNYILGEQVQNFEDEFANYCGTNFCIGTGNGLDALTLILKGYIALDRLQKGDSVMVAANTFVATILAVKQAGLKPVLVEPDEKTFNLDPRQVAKHWNSEIKAILTTHLYGHLSPVEELNQLAKKRNILLIADAAQAHGAEDIFKERAGSLSDATGFSFYPTKNLGALGDGGCVTTDDAKLTEVVRKLRNYGSKTKYENQYVGVNSRLDELQAVFLRCKLPNLDTDNQRRREIAQQYILEVKNPKIKSPFWDGTKNHVFDVFAVRVKNREGFCAHLEKNKIGYLMHYPIAPHRQKAFPEMKKLSLPISERIHREVVSIPLNPVMKKDEVSEVINVLNNY